MGLHRRAWVVEQPFQGRVVREEVQLPGPDEVLVEAEWGAVSAGSEYLVFSGAAQKTMELDAAADGTTGDSVYPLRYGYILTGRVAFCGARVNSEQWLGRRVYAFHPHATHAILPVDRLLPIPDGIAEEAAPLYANTETAVSLHWDAALLPGESVIILGAGIVGLLVAGIAARSGAGWVVLVDADQDRRRWAERYLRAAGCGSALATVDVVASLEQA
ncbi:MAG: hypothetical protein ACOCU4_10525, partial [Alkalispirochaeta sp.]